MRRRNQRGNCGLIIAVVLAILGLIIVWVIVAETHDHNQRCEELKRWFQANPYDTNPDLNRDYRLCQ